MEPVFDVAGSPVAWLYRQQFLIDRTNTCRAFVRDRVVYALGRRVVGSFADGYFWDMQGEAIAFVRGATNGPVLPAPHNPGPAPIPPATTVPALPPVVAALSARRIKWSPLTLDTVLSMSATRVRRERRQTGQRLGASYRKPAGVSR